MVEHSNETEKSLVFRLGGEQALDPYQPINRTSIVLMDSTVAVHSEQFKTGKNKHSGAVWERWATVHTTYYSLKQERENLPLLRMYTSKKVKERGKVFRNETPLTLSMLLAGTAPHKPYQTVVQNMLVLLFVNYRLAEKTNTDLPRNAEELKRNVLNLAYPTTRFFHTIKAEDIASAVASNSKIWRGTTDIKLYLQKQLGVAYVRKDMIKSVEKIVDPKHMEVFRFFRRLVPVDWTILLIKGDKNYALTNMKTRRQAWEDTCFSEANRKNIIKFFKLLNIHQKKRFYLSTEKDLDSYILRDTFSLLEKITLPVVEEKIEELDLTNWRSLHDSASKMFSRIKHAPKPVPQEEMVKLDGCELKVEEKTYTIKSPKMTNELIEWGHQLDNCIATYANQVLRGDTTVFAVYDEQSRLKANLEIRNGYLVQFVERFNSPVKAPMEKALLQLMEEKDVKPSKDHKSYRRGLNVDWDELAVLPAPVPQGDVAEF